MPESEGAASQDSAHAPRPTTSALQTLFIILTAAPQVKGVNSARAGKTAHHLYSGMPEEQHLWYVALAAA